MSDDGAPVSGATVDLSLSGNGDLLSDAANTPGAASAGRSFPSVPTGANGQSVAWIDVPTGGTTAETVSITFVDPSGASHQPSTAVTAPVTG